MARAPSHRTRCKVVRKPTRVQPTRRAKVPRARLRSESAEPKGTATSTIESPIPHEHYPTRVTRARRSNRLKDSKKKVTADSKVSSEESPIRVTQSTSKISRTGPKKLHKETTPPSKRSPQPSPALAAIESDQSASKPRPFVFQDPLNDPPPPIPEGHKLIHLVRHCRAWHKYNYNLNPNLFVQSCASWR